MNGEVLDQSIVAGSGLVGDRAYALIDRTNGKVASAKHPRKWGKLLGFSASFVEAPRDGEALPPVLIAGPDGETLRSDCGSIDARLSDAVGRPVHLTTKRPDAVSLERLDPLDEQGSILDIGELMMAGCFSDYAALHLITSATLARLSNLGPGSRFDARRFRPNLVIDTGDRPGFVENDWVGRTIAIGQDLVLRISDPTPRCSIPTLAQDGLAKDPAILRTIVGHNRLPVPLLDGEVLPCAGVYGFVVEAGVVRKGDKVRDA